MSATEPVLLASMISSGSAIMLAIISRLRFRCMPDRETGKCICQSGCSEVPLPGADEEEDRNAHARPERQERVDRHRARLG